MQEKDNIDPKYQRTPRQTMTPAWTSFLKSASFSRSPNLLPRLQSARASKLAARRRLIILSGSLPGDNLPFAGIFKNFYVWLLQLFQAT
ncbi:hypothetical protein EJB05_29814 [Eragrostis curvula]|uniref:Uncharacterized protein n=1 Tax=Eragrostis curvula TaxID=38414 RepID=A0A5J9UVD2_9POAL|nr:hypothetical protein EJB05_29814 [Eragrostis curvula]